MPSILRYLGEGSRIFLKSWKSRISSKKYEGDAETICKKIVEDCWNERFFQISTGNFNQFWTRDFGWCVASLLKLGYEKEVQATLRYAMNRFKKVGKITTTVTPGGKPYDFPTIAVDSLPWFIHSLKLAKFNYYDFRHFLDKQIQVFYDTFIEKKTGLVKKELHVSSMKDFALRQSSCYDNCMVGMLANDLKSMKLLNPFKKFDYSNLIMDHFWNGNYFYDDLQKKSYVAGDANIFPFITGMADKDKIAKVIVAIQKEGLDKPFPLKYTKSRQDVKFIWQEVFLPDYESNAIWTHMGPLYIKMVALVDGHLADSYKKMYTEMIEKHSNYLEVFAKDKPYQSPFYYCDSGMLWAANYLTI